MFNGSKLILKLAYQNLWRRRGRTLVTIAMITVALGLLIFMSGLYDGWVDKWIQDSIESDTGQIVVFAKDYRLSEKLSDRIKSPQIVSAVLTRNKNVKVYAPRLKNEGIVSSAQYSGGVLIVGIEVSKDAQVTNLKRSLVKGIYAFEPGKKEAIIGTDLAESLKVKLNSKIVLMAQASDKEIASSAYRVVGMVRTNNPAIDKYAVFIGLEDAQKMFKIQNAVTQFSILIKDPKFLDQTKTELQKSLSHKYAVYTWKEMMRGLEWMLEVMQNYKTYSFVVVFVIVAIGIFNIVLISILERIREFGIMLAVGTRFFQLAQIIIWESLLVGIIGLVLGCLLGLLVLLYFHWFGLDLSYFASGLAQFGFSAIIHTSIKAEYFIMSALAVLITSILATLWPIRILKKLKPIQAIRFL